MYDVNPVYEYFDGQRFGNALKGLRVSVSLNGRMDETTELCKFIAPSSHFLESWGDAEPKPGYISMMQPTISPLFKTRQFQDTLLKWTGNPTTYDLNFASCKRCTQKVHFSMTPRLRTVTSGLSTIRVRSSFIINTASSSMPSSCMVF